MGLLDKIKNLVNKDYAKGLEKTRDFFNQEINLLNNKHKKISDEYFEDLEEILIKTDMGINMTLKFIDKLKKRVKEENITDTTNIKEIIVDELFISYVDNTILSNKINYNESGLTVILVVGVNGVGKTTSIAKLAYNMQNSGKKAMLVAADTFRAGAKEQLIEWGTRLNIPVYSNESSDAASVVYEGINKALETKCDVVLIDTAGRIQNKDNLMQELGKINKVIKNLIGSEVHETLLVIDATTGQNGISQAKSFKEVVSITGIVLTKLDGTAKGGIVLAIKEEVAISVKYIGIGEAKEDLKVFDIETYIYNLVEDLKDE